MTDHFGDSLIRVLTTGDIPTKARVIKAVPVELAATEPIPILQDWYLFGIQERN